MSKRKPPKSRVRMKTGRAVSYRRRGHPSGHPSGTPEQSGVAIEKRAPVEDEQGAAMVLTMDRARAQASQDMEERAIQHVQDEERDSKVDRATIRRRWTGIMAEFLLSPRMIRLTKQRCVEDPAFHIRAIDKTVPTPQAVRAEEGASTPVVLILGGGLSPQYMAKDGAIDVKAENVMPGGNGDVAKKLPANFPDTKRVPGVESARRHEVSNESVGGHGGELPEGEVSFSEDEDYR